MTTALDDVLAKHSIEVHAQFVPFSMSRNKDNKERSLNWKIVISRRTRPVLTTDYSAGIGHCPSYKFMRPKLAYDRREYNDRIEAETEKGFAAIRIQPSWMTTISLDKKRPIQPSIANVLESLVLDYSILDAGSFENWASEFGYDTDSRKAEATYRACLDIALKLRAGLGDTIIGEIREAIEA